MARILTLAAALCAAVSLPAQSPDAALKTAFDGWNVQWRAYVDAMTQARTAGQIRKGGTLPDAVQAKLDAADAARDAVLREFGARDDLSAASHGMLARLHEQARDYAAAVADYAKGLARGDAASPDLATLHSICIAAMNSKDDRLAARWMRTTIAAEDAAGPSRGDLSVRTSYFPRTLIALEAWDELAQHLGKLAEEDAAACRAAAATFGVVVAIHRGELDDAQRRIDAILAAPEAYPDHQAWAVLVQLALCAGRGAFDDGARTVREFLAADTPASASAVDKNQRRYLTAIEPFLGGPAPHVQVDEWVGGTVLGDDLLRTLRGHVVVLDFWQPWCEPCRKAMPHLVALQERHPEDLTVIGLCKVEDYGYDVSERRAVRPIAPADYADHVADFHADMGLNYALGIARSGVNSETYHVTGIPTLVVIDREGIVRYMSCGAGEPGLLELAIEGVLRTKT